MSEIVSIYVPADEPVHPSLATVSRGSAIVGGKLEAPPGYITVDFEGNIYDSPMLGRWADRIHHAAGRHIERYPTVARRSVPAEALIEVGSYLADEGRVLLEGEPGPLHSWLGVESLHEEDLLASGYRFQMRRAIDEGLNSSDPAKRRQAEILATQHGL